MLFFVKKEWFAHTGLGPTNAVGPPFNASIVVTLLPDEYRARTDPVGALLVCQASCDEWQRADSNGFLGVEVAVWAGVWYYGPGTTHEDLESIERVLYVQSGVCGSLRGHFSRGWDRQAGRLGRPPARGGGR